MTRREFTLTYHHEWVGSPMVGYDWTMFRVVADGQIELGSGHTFTLWGAKRESRRVAANDAENVEHMTVTNWRITATNLKDWKA